MKDSKLRKEGDNQKIKQFVEHLDFFQKIEQNITQQKYKQLISRIKIERFPQYHTLFRIDDLAKHFYIILKGSVYVLTPFLSTDSQDDKLENIFKNPNDDEKMLIKENSSMKVAVVLGQGKSFGDTALANRINRTATIVCKETCFFASLNQLDYAEIIEQYHQQFFHQNIAIFKDIFIFNDWEDQFLGILFQQSNTIYVNKGQIIYQPGDKAQDFYIIKKGEFVLSKEIQHIVKENKPQDPALSLPVSHNYNDLYQINNIWKKMDRKIKGSLQQVGILGYSEIFGIFELNEGLKQRRSQVICTSNEGGILIAISYNTFKKSIRSKVQFETLLKYEKIQQRWQNQNLSINKSLPGLQINYNKERIKEFQKSEAEKKDLSQIQSQNNEKRDLARVWQNKKLINLNSVCEFQNKKKEKSEQFASSQKKFQRIFAQTDRNKNEVDGQKQDLYKKQYGFISNSNLDKIIEQQSVQTSPLKKDISPIFVRKEKTFHHNFGSQSTVPKSDIHLETQFSQEIMGFEEWKKQKSEKMIQEESKIKKAEQSNDNNTIEILENQQNKENFECQNSEQIQEELSKESSKQLGKTKLKQMNIISRIYGQKIGEGVKLESQNNFCIQNKSSINSRINTQNSIGSGETNNRNNYITNYEINSPITCREINSKGNLVKSQTQRDYFQIKNNLVKSNTLNEFQSNEKYNLTSRAQEKRQNVAALQEDKIICNSFIQNNKNLLFGAQFDTEQKSYDQNNFFQKVIQNAQLMQINKTTNGFSFSDQLKLMNNKNKEKRFLQVQNKVELIKKIGTKKLETEIHQFIQDQSLSPSNKLNSLNSQNSPFLLSQSYKIIDFNSIIKQGNINNLNETQQNSSNNNNSLNKFKINRSNVLSPQKYRENIIKEQIKNLKKNDVRFHQKYIQQIKKFDKNKFLLESVNISANELNN